MIKDLWDNRLPLGFLFLIVMGGAAGIVMIAEYVSADAAAALAAVASFFCFIVGLGAYLKARSEHGRLERRKSWPQLY